MRETIYNDVETPRGSAPPRRLQGDVDWFDLAIVLSKHRKQILKAALIGLALSTIVAFILPAKYTAKGQVLPPSGNTNVANMLMGSMASGNGAMGGAASSMLSGALNIKNPSDLYVAMLKSRTVADAVITKFDYRKGLFGTESWEDARKRLEKHTDISVGKEGVITIEVEDRSPERARQIAQAYIDELFKLSETVSISEAGQRRIFFDKQLLAEKDQLANAEIELKKVQQATGLIVPSEQARASIEGVARIRGMISAKEVQIAAMQHFASANNPELQQAQQELAALREQLGRLERGQPGVDMEGSSIVAPGKVPESSLEFIRKYRDFKYHETIYELLAKQVELARLDEAKDYAALQVLDAPVTPDKRSKPMRSAIIAIGTLLWLLAASVYWIYREKSSDPDRSSAWQRWEVVKSYWQRGSR